MRLGGGGVAVVEAGWEVPGSSIVVVAVAVRCPEEAGTVRKRGMTHSVLQGCRGGRLHLSWRVQVLHRFAGVVDVEGQWILWKTGAEDGILLAEGPAVLEVVDGLSVRAGAAGGGPVLLGPGLDGISMKILIVGVCKLQTPMT